MYRCSLNVDCLAGQQVELAGGGMQVARTAPVHGSETVAARAIRLRYMQSKICIL